MTCSCGLAWMLNKWTWSSGHTAFGPNPCEGDGRGSPIWGVSYGAPWGSHCFHCAPLKPGSWTSSICVMESLWERQSLRSYPRPTETESAFDVTIHRGTLKFKRLVLKTRWVLEGWPFGSLLPDRGSQPWQHLRISHRSSSLWNKFTTLPICGCVHQLGSPWTPLFRGFN